MGESAIAESVTVIDREPTVDWPAIIAGAIGAAGISFTLQAFGAAIGLSIMSAAPTWRDSSPWLWLLSGLFLLFLALAAFGLGGYITGRMRARADIAASESMFRDGLHGLVTWALAILMTALLALGTAAALSRTVAPSGGNSGPSTSVAGENIIASELDELFRTDRSGSEGDLTYRRAEAARILLKSSSHSGVSPEDRYYLAIVTANTTGMRLEDAATRVDRVIGESARELHRARVAAVLQAFMIGAALFVGAAVAWLAAVEGGRERDSGSFPTWDWSFRGRPRNF